MGLVFRFSRWKVFFFLAFLYISNTTVLIQVVRVGKQGKIVAEYFRGVGGSFVSFIEEVIRFVSFAGEGERSVIDFIYVIYICD